jgi:hypothetical protein
MKIIRHEEGGGWMLGDYQDYLEANVGRFSARRKTIRAVELAL